MSNRLNRLNGNWNVLRYVLYYLGVGSSFFLGQVVDLTETTHRKICHDLFLYPTFLFSFKYNILLFENNPQHTKFQIIMSNFQKVVAFNRTFDVPVHESVQHNVWTKNPDLVKLRMSLIREEMKELEEAVANHDMVETTDALVDILYVVYGMGASLGVNLDGAFDIVHSSNMSKVCRTEEDAKITVQKYKEEGRYDSPYYYKAGADVYIVKNKSTGKVLKNHKYVEANFESILSRNK
jgi:predicted HAD superfamily Cof-like phosphohydrolase